MGRLRGEAEGDIKTICNYLELIPTTRASIIDNLQTQLGEVGAILCLLVSPWGRIATCCHLYMGFGKRHFAVHVILKMPEYLQLNLFLVKIFRLSGIHVSLDSSNSWYIYYLFLLQEGP